MRRALRQALPVYCDVSGPQGATLTYKAVGDCVVNADQDGDGNYAKAATVSQKWAVGSAPVNVSASLASVTLTVGVAPPPNTRPVSAGNGNGTFSYASDPVTALSDLGLSFDSTGALTGTPTKALSSPRVIAVKVTSGGASSSANFTLMVNKGAQTINFTAPATPATVNTTASLVASSSAGVGYPVKFSIADGSKGKCSVKGTTVSYEVAGDCVINADQVGDGNYNKADTVSQTVQVNPAALAVVSSGAIPTLKVGVAFTPFTPVTASGGAVARTYGLDPNTPLPEGLRLDTSSGTIRGDPTPQKAFTGSIGVIVTSGVENKSGYFTLTVEQGTQTITFNQAPPASVTVGTSGTLAATSSVGGSYPVTFSSSSTGICTVTWTSVSYGPSTGDCVITASQVGDANYAAASASQTVKVNAAALAASPLPINPLTVGVAAPPNTKPVTATGGTGSYTYATVPSTALADMGLGTLSLGSDGVLTGASTKAYSGSISFTAKDSDGTISSTSSFQLTIGQGTQAITFNPAPPASVTVGTTGTLAATSSAAGSYPVTFSSSSTGICTVTGTSVSYGPSTGDCLITASQVGDANYAAASASQTVRVNAAALAASPLPINPLTVGVTAPPNTKPVTATGGTGSYTYATVSPTALADLGLGTLSLGSDGVLTGASTKAYSGSISFTAKDSDGTISPTSSFQLTIGQGTQTITFNQAPPASVTVGTSGTLAATSSAGGSYPVTFSSSTTGICTVTGTSVSYGPSTGDCVITASQVGDANYASASASQTVRVNATALTAVLSGTIPTLKVGVDITPFMPVIASGGSGKYYFDLADGSSLPADLTLDRNTGLIRGKPRVAGPISFSILVSDASAPGRGAIPASILLALASNLQASPPSPVRVSLQVDPASQSTTIALQATPNPPRVGQKVLLTATMGASAATGTVTFKDGTAVIGSSTLAGGTASVTTAALSAGTHSFTAVYSGDGAYASVTSDPLSVTATARPNPTADKNVRALVAAQSAVPQRVGLMQLDLVQRRLEVLHDDDVPAFVNGLSVSAPSSLPSGASPFDDPMLKGQGFSQGDASKALDRTLDKNFGKFSALGSDKDAPARRNSFGALEGSRFKVWTAGSVIFGGVNVSALGVETKTHFTLSGVTAGIDTMLMDGVKAGFAVSFTGQSDDLGGDGSKISSRTVTGQLYASWRMVDKLFLDGTVGYGDMSFSSKRLDVGAASFLSGNRRGKMLFGSLALSYDAKMGPLSFAPYARLDLIDASLAAYTETGDASLALSYEKSTMSSQSLTLGLRGQYDIAQSWGVLSPTWRAEYRRLLSGDLTQAMSYATEASTSYAITTTASDRDTISAALGLKARSTGDVTSSLEYLLSGGLKGGLQGQGLRGMLRVGF